VREAKSAGVPHGLADANYDAYASLTGKRSDFCVPPPYGGGAKIRRRSHPSRVCPPP